MCALFESAPLQPLGSIEPAPFDFPKIAGAEIAAAIYRNRVAGDFYDCFRVGTERALFGLLDVAGRANTNRRILDAAQKTFRSLGTELFSSSDVNESDAMVQICIRLNHRIMEEAGGVHSCPAFIGCYHERFGTLCYTNAGHTPGLLRDGDGVVELASTGLPLGLFSHATCDAPTVGLEKTAALLLVSRGAVEGKARNGDGDDAEPGLARAKEFLQSDRSQSAQSLCASILHELGETAGDQLDPEDMTALALVRTA
jgi:sigma-B regulation protein RsbU (phosphoserine phosphatase)